jgi:hypothetical protein
MDIQVSIVASANRVQWWERMYNSLQGNSVNWELILVGDTPPLRTYPDNFRWIEATVKPAQCYEIGFRAAKGEIVGWTADDADYNHKTRNCPNAIDLVYHHYKEFEKKYGDNKTVIAMRPIEDGGDVYNFHHFFGNWHHTPVMAPFGFINREWFVNTLGGYDKNFVSGQSENDVVMRAIEAGGRVELCLDCFLYVHHGQVHPRNRETGKDTGNKFRAWYNVDREYLERCWVVGGYGNYESKQQNVKISPTRLCPVDRFDDKDICTITQGALGQW